MYVIVAGWDDPTKAVTRYNSAEIEGDAAALVDQLHGVGPDALPPAKQSPQAYYALAPAAEIGTASLQHRAAFWDADPVNKQVSFNTSRCHAWAEKLVNHSIDREADRRVDFLTSPDDSSRAERIRSEMPDGPTKDALMTQCAAVRASAEALKGSLLVKNPEEVLQTAVDDAQNWP